MSDNADDFSIYTKSRRKARKVGNEILSFLKDNSDCPINKEKAAIADPL